MARVYTGQRVFLSPVLAPVERLAYRAIGVDPARRAGLAGLRAHGGRLQRALLAGLYAILRTQGIQPFNPEGFGSGPWELSFNTASSFVTNTNWQFYGGEATPLLLLPDGRPRGAELRLGRGRDGGPRRRDPRLRQPRQRPSSATSGRDLDPHPALHPPAALASRRATPRLPGRRPDPLRLPHLLHAGRGPSRRWRSARPPRRSRSSSSAPTAAASSASTARCRSRTRPRSRTSSRSLFILLIPAAAYRHLWPHGRQPPPGLGAVRGDGGDVGRRRSPSATAPSRTARLLSRRPGSRPRAADGTSGGNLRGQGAALRDRRQRRVGDGDDRRLQRLGQLRPRRLHRRSAARC